MTTARYWEVNVYRHGKDGYDISGYKGLKELRQKLQDAFSDEDFPASSGD